MRVLLVIDGSKYFEAPTQVLIAQAKPHETEVRIPHVIEIMTSQLPEMMTYYPGIDHARDAQRGSAEGLVTKTAELLRSKGLEACTAVKLGDAKSMILDDATEWRADLIVLGLHGKTGLDRFLTGSVADAVARHARCSVEIVRIMKDRKCRAA